MPDRDALSRHDAYRSVRFFGSLDGLRCLCLAMVLWHHGIWGFIVDVPTILTRGFTGVDFFFVLSGFLITTLLLREEAQTGRISLYGFYRRRFLRIVPVYFLAVTVISLYWIVVKGQDRFIPMLPYYYLFLANFLIDDIDLLSPMWSLAVEEQYYLLWPLLLLVLPALVRVRLAVVLALIAVCVVVSQGLLPPIEVAPPNEIARFTLPVGSYAAILIGSCLAILLHVPSGFAALWRLVGWRWAPVAFMAATFLALHFLPQILMGWPNLVVHSLMALTLAAIVVREDHVLAGIMRIRIIARIGQISYGTYIWHLCGRHIGVEVTQALGLEGLAAHVSMMTIFVVSAIVIGELSFRFFESFFLRFKVSRPSRTVPGGAVR